MPELMPDQELCDISKEELKKFSEDDCFINFFLVIDSKNLNYL